MKLSVLLITILSFFLRNCSYDKVTQPIPLNNISTRDTCLKILHKHKFSDQDTIEYLRFYDKFRFSLSFVKIGEFISPGLKSGVIIYTPNDSSISTELYTLNMSGWALSDKKINLKTSWLMFYPNFADYDFDGRNDIYINTNISNGNALSSGYLLTVKDHGRLIEHPETKNIRDMTPNKEEKVIYAHKYLGCLQYDTIYEERYKWIDNKLILISKPLDCK